MAALLEPGVTAKFLQPVIAVEFPLSSAAEAHHEVMEHKQGSCGKIILTIWAAALPVQRTVLSFNTRSTVANVSIINPYLFTVWCICHAYACVAPSVLWPSDCPPPENIIWAMMIVWRIRQRIIRTVLCCVVYDSCAKWYTHMSSS